MGSSSGLQYVYRWRISQWSSLEPCVEHDSPPFDADGLRWVFKLFKGRAKNPKSLALYLAVHASAVERLRQQKKKVDISFSLENLGTRGLDYSKYTRPVTVWVDAEFSTWGDDKFIDLRDMLPFVAGDTACLAVRFHIRETVYADPHVAVSEAIALFVPERIAAPFNRLLKSSRFSDVVFELRDSSALLLSPGPATSPDDPPHGLLSPRASGDYSVHRPQDPLCIRYSPDTHAPRTQQPSPQLPAHCTTPMPGSSSTRALPYATLTRLGETLRVHRSRAALPVSRYHAHKAILSAVSPVFEAMFSNGMRESYADTIEVWDVTPRAFERLLEFAYTTATDTVRAPKHATLDEIVETLLCADQFEVRALADQCWQELSSRLAPDTVWDIWAVAAALESRAHIERCRAYCCRNFARLARTPHIMWAPPHLLRDVLSADKLDVQTEESLFELVVRWAGFRAEDEPLRGDQPDLTCYRSPSNLALLPRRRRSAALTREVHTSADMVPVEHVRVQSGECAGAWSGGSASRERKEFLETLLPCIRFPMMAKEYLLNVVEKNAELMSLPVMKDLIIEAYRYHAFNPIVTRHDANGPKVILPLGATDHLTLSRSQRRKWAYVLKSAVQDIDFTDPM